MLGAAVVGAAVVGAAVVGAAVVGAPVVGAAVVGYESMRSPPPPQLTKCKTCQATEPPEQRIERLEGNDEPPKPIFPSLFAISSVMHPVHSSQPTATLAEKNKSIAANKEAIAANKAEFDKRILELLNKVQILEQTQSEAGASD